MPEHYMTQGMNPMIGPQGSRGSVGDPSGVTMGGQQLPPELAEMRGQFASEEEFREFITQMMKNYGGEAGDAQRAMDRADDQQLDTPQGRNVRDFYVASNPVEHMATALRNRQSQKQYETGKGELGDARAGANQARTQAATQSPYAQNTLADLLRQR